MNNFTNLSKQELLNLLEAYDNYIINDGEPWNEDRQPVSVSEFYDNEYQYNDGEPEEEKTIICPRCGCKRIFYKNGDILLFCRCNLTHSEINNAIIYAEDQNT